MSDVRIAVIIPCLDEVGTIGDVVRGFRMALPNAEITVVDNGSTDGTAAVARSAGASVLSEPRRGKGRALRCAFSAIEAEIYLMVDGDGTYDPTDAAALIRRLIDGDLDIVNAARVPMPGALGRRRRFGNRIISAALARVFGSPFRDPLSGYKVLSKRFVDGFPARSTGFEVETELVVHAAQTAAPSDELFSAYRPRPPGSASKLSVLRDGVRIAQAAYRLSRDARG